MRARADDRVACFDMVTAIIQHVNDTCHGAVRWSLVPGYWNLVLATLDRLMVCGAMQRRVVST
jgi:hypothetical protein